MTLTWKSFNEKLTPSIQGQVKLRKLAGLFAGLGHMQPLLLATTNSHYLLDRFCMERCCSGEYISRIVTSLIFMEVIATLLVACIGVGVACTYSTNWSGATGVTLNDWNEQYEEKWRGRISSGIQLLILLGYFQILEAFVSGGKKGHMHWFYVSLMFQQFVCLLIGGAIGFWEGGVTLWYLMAIPMGPIPVFFYQLMIHSWIRNNGPRYPERLVVEWQIGLALFLSGITTTLWIHAYATPYYPIELDIPENLPSSVSRDTKRINTGSITLQTAYSLAKTNGQFNPLTKNSVNLPVGSDVQVESVELTTYSLTLTTAKISGGDNYVVNLTLKAELKIEFNPNGEGKTVESVTAKITEQPKTLALTTTPTSSTSKTLNVYSANLKPNVNDKTVTLTIQSIKAGEEVTIASPSSTTTVTINTVEVTIPVNIVVKTERGEQSETIKSVKLTLPANKTGGSDSAEYSSDQKLELSPVPTV